jgi:Ribosomal protein S21
MGFSLESLPGGTRVTRTRRQVEMASALATFAASVFKGTFNVEIQVGDNEPSEAAIRRFRRGVLNSGVLPEVRQRANTPGACAASG